MVTSQNLQCFIKNNIKLSISRSSFIYFRDIDLSLYIKIFRIQKMKRISFSLFFLLLFVLNISFTSAVNNPKHSVESKKIIYNLHTPWVDSVLNTLTPDERIAQMMMVATYPFRDQKYFDEISCLIKNYNIGGLIFFQGSPVLQAKQTNIYQSIAKTPLLVSIDAEWGLGMRMDSALIFPRQMMLGAIQDDSLIYKMGVEIANQLKAMGIHINFAPVVDVNSNPLNPVISNRSFGENKYMVAKKGVLYMQGMQANGIIATAKHFPGHGDTNEDSHYTLPTVKYQYGRLDSMELYPFRQLILNNVGGVMIAHLHMLAFDTAYNMAYTISRRIVNGLLKDSLKYTGLVVTDALSMKGVSSFFKPGVLEVKAVEAGNDILLNPTDVPLAIKSIRDAINAGFISQSQIDSSCRKILAAKEWAVLKKLKPIDIVSLRNRLNSPAATLIQRKIIEAGLTLVRNQDNILPLRSLDTLRMAVVLVGADKPGQFEKTLSLYKDFDCFYLGKRADSLKIDSLLFSLRHYNLVIAGVLNTDSRPLDDYGIAPNAYKFLERLVDSKSVVLDLFATPYSLAKFKKLEKYKAILISYQDQTLMQDYSAQMIFGAIGAKGKLPVTALPYSISTGISTPSGLRLKYSIPEELNIDSRKLAEVDSIVVKAIRHGAMPGCQVLAAKNGIVFYQKSFGYHTYDHTLPVLNSDLYDIASITKIAGTLPAVMKLYDEGKIVLTNKLSNYLPELKKTNKKNVLLIDVLTHQAKLQPYMAFYLNTIEPVKPGERLTSNTYSSTYSLKLGENLYANKQIKYRDGLFSSHADREHNVQVADSLFLSRTYPDTIFKLSNESNLMPVKEYKYSDMGFYYMYWMVERVTKTALNEYMDINFYRKLGTTTMGYLPLNHFSKERIMPTEDDVVFRKQVVLGYVHDPGAAMMGGVCGHAGVFSNANDLAKLMQMYMNKGFYGGEQFFKPSTFDYFNSCPFCSAHNRRGIGFDKPDMHSKAGPTCNCVSAKTFGHQGFTGCVTWADPETGLLYIFLSNRVYPDANNNKLAETGVRTRIQEVLVKAISK